MTADIAAAVQALRDSVAGLPDWAQAKYEPWRANSDDVATAGDWPLMHVYRLGGQAERELFAAHVARTASPDVVRAVADLLDEIHSTSGTDEHRLDEIRSVAGELAAAILRSPGGTT